jgi:hypothetical protein
MVITINIVDNTVHYSFAVRLWCFYCHDDGR